MSVTFPVSRIEGGLTLEQTDNGAIRLITRRWLGIEMRLAGRAALEGVYLSQQAGADASASHAIAAAIACEKAAGIAPPRNALLLRELIQSLAAIHAHLRQFYVQALPDYAPWGEMANYRGARPDVQRQARALKARPATNWARTPQSNTFTAAQLERLWDNQARALETLAALQRMLARLGGKFPMIMSIAPGGCTVPLTDALLLGLREDLQQAAPIADGLAYEDGLMVAASVPRLRTLGRSGTSLMCVGTQGEGLPESQTRFPPGLFAGDHLDTYTPAVTESVAHSLYQIPAERRREGAVLLPAPAKPDAYSWIKAPRNNNRAMEVGALSRLAILHHGIGPGDTADLLDDLAKTLSPGSTVVPLTAASSVAGRMLARLIEARILMRRCDELLEQLAPGQPTVADTAAVHGATGEGVAEVEAPAGSLRHRVSLRDGKVGGWDIIGPSTWNGSPPDESGQRGPLEGALASAGLNLKQKEDRLTASHIVHSFAFSTTDAIH